MLGCALMCVSTVRHRCRSVLFRLSTLLRRAPRGPCVCQLCRACHFHHRWGSATLRLGVRRATLCGVRRYGLPPLHLVAHYLFMIPSTATFGCGGSRALREARRLVVRVRQRVASQPSAMRRPRATARTPGWAGAARQSREWAGRPRNTSVWERGIAGQVRQSQRVPSQVLPIWQPFRAHSSAPDLKGGGRTARSARCRCGHSGCPDCAHGVAHVRVCTRVAPPSVRNARGWIKYDPVGRGHEQVKGSTALQCATCVLRSRSSAAVEHGVPHFLRV